MCKIYTQDNYAFLALHCEILSLIDICDTTLISFTTFRSNELHLVVYGILIITKHSII